MKNVIKKKYIRYIIGVDEVGRGPIAGPVAVGAFMCSPDFFNSLPTNFSNGKKIKIRDSKKLSKNRREDWFNYLSERKKQGECNFAVSFVSSDMIDKFGINKCIQKALDKSLDKVIKQNHLNLPRFTPEGSYTDENLNDFVLFLDGGLKAPKNYLRQKTIIKGDELNPVISLASIVAKVSRDKIMTQYALKYPKYGFEKHVGYGTKAHYEAIKKYGQTPIHRKTFIH